MTEEVLNRVWRVLAALKSGWCELTGHHDPQPVFGEIYGPELPEQPIPPGFASVCERCMVVTLYNGKQLYGRRTS